MELDTIDEETFEERVLRAPLPVLVDFTTPWCGPCQALKPVLEKIARDHRERVRVYVIDADRHPALATRFGIRGFPTTLAFAKGAEVGRQLGVATEKRLLSLFPSGQVATL